MKFLGLFSFLLVAGFSTIQGNTEPSPIEIFIEAEGAQIFCRILGEGPPIVVIHGGPGLSQDYLLPQMAKLGETNLVIFYDQRASGRSTGEINADSISVETFLNDLETLRKFFGFQKMTVLGHSWGGFLAMKYAIAYPNSLNKLILVNPLPPSSDGFSLFVREWIRRMAPFQEELKMIRDTQEFQEGDPSTMERYHRIIFRNYCYDPNNADLLNLSMTPKTSLDGAKVHELFRQHLLKPFDFYDELKNVKNPTLILHGDADLIPSASIQKIHENLSNSTYILLPNCGHFPYIEAPDALFEHLRAFYQST